MPIIIKGLRNAHCIALRVSFQVSTLIIKTQHCIKWAAVGTHWHSSTPTILAERFLRGFSVAAVHWSCFFSGHWGWWMAGSGWEQRIGIRHNGRQMDCDKNRWLGAYRNERRAWSVDETRSFHTHQILTFFHDMFWCAWALKYLGCICVWNTTPV